MHAELQARLHAFAREHGRPDEGRPISELIKTNEMLRGWESQRLRTFCTSECMEPGRDLDEYGKILLTGNMEAVQLDYMLRLSKKAALGSTEEAQAAVAKDIYDLRWGPTTVPIYNLLGLFMIIMPKLRGSYLDIARFLIDTVKVPVNGLDMSGTTALSHSFSTKPGLDFEYAQLLFDAGGDVNNRNRYGATVGQEIVQVYLFDDKKVVSDAENAFKWFLAHGGNIDVADTDGSTVRDMVGKLSRLVPNFMTLAAKEDKRRTALGVACCKFCGREDNKLLFCGRCRKVKYCQPPARTCQRLDWPRHKKECKA